MSYKYLQSIGEKRIYTDSSFKKLSKEYASKQSTFEKVQEDDSIDTKIFRQNWELFLWATTVGFTQVKFNDLIDLEKTTKSDMTTWQTVFNKAPDVFKSLIMFSASVHPFGIELLNDDNINELTSTIEKYCKAGCDIINDNVINNNWNLKDYTTIIRELKGRSS